MKCPECGKFPRTYLLTYPPRFACCGGLFLSDGTRVGDWPTRKDKAPDVNFRGKGWAKDGYQR